MATIGEAVNVLRKGGVVVFPTDTVWGVGAAVSNSWGIKKLYQVMKRMQEKPTAVLVADLSMAERYGLLEGRARELAIKYWPGGLTLVVPAREEAPREILGQGQGVGLRVPDHPMMQSLISELGEGLVASSANRLGEKTPLSREEVDQDFLTEVDLVLEGESGRGDASTVVMIEKGEIKVVRQGGVRIEESRQEERSQRD